MSQRYKEVMSCKVAASASISVRKVQVTWLAELGPANSFICHFAC
jgi:hypothetical protein